MPDAITTALGEHSPDLKVGPSRRPISSRAPTILLPTIDWYHHVQASLYTSVKISPNVPVNLLRSTPLTPRLMMIDLEILVTVGYCAPQLVQTVIMGAPQVSVTRNTEALGATVTQVLPTTVVECPTEGDKDKWQIPPQ